MCTQRVRRRSDTFAAAQILSLIFASQNTFSCQLVTASTVGPRNQADTPRE
jgi:hypothetical protein